MENRAEPYSRYIAIEDQKSRPSHAALNGKVFKKDDPLWDTHYPPNGFGCRCRVEGVTPSRFPIGSASRRERVSQYV